MAGLFRFFSSEKEGTGVFRELPKKGVKRFFALYFNSFRDITVIGLVSWLFSLPVLTGDMASTAMARVISNIVTQSHTFGLSDFFESLKKNWKQTLWLGIINTGITAVLAVDLFLCFSNAQQTAAAVGMFLLAELLLFFAVARFYMRYMAALFSFDLKTVYLNSLKLSLAALGRNFLLLLVLGGTYGVLFALVFVPVPPIQIILYLLCLLLLPGFQQYAIGYFVFPPIKKYVIDPYYRDHPDQDIELRRNRNMLDE